MVISDILKKIILYILALVAFCLCGSFVLAIFDIILDMNMEIVTNGIKCGLFAWVIMFIIVPLFKRKKVLK